MNSKFHFVNYKFDLATNVVSDDVNIKVKNKKK